ncbi:hypothetical protein CPB86DRAFT_779389 [Serendipita vermifera]|nr:hypothetical protein CPB86DRAFT_779389 [Serendipita vermifera]
MSRKVLLGSHLTTTGPTSNQFLVPLNAGDTYHFGQAVTFSSNGAQWRLRCALDA